MKNRLAKTLLATVAVAAFAAPVGAQARQGADYPAGHVRHASHQTTAKSAAAAKHHTKTRDRHRHGGRHDRNDDRVSGHRHRHGGRHDRNDDRVSGRRHGRGSDDATNERHGRGTDDGPNHR